jgi:hypothetical protein
MSTLLVEECLAAEDARFVEVLRGVAEPKALAALTNRWLADPRPWASEQMLRYLEEPIDRPGHAVVVKRMFKHAEKTNDVTLMAAFLAAFDCLVRRVRRKESLWDMASRSHVTEEVLHTPRNWFRKPRVEVHFFTKKQTVVPREPRKSDRLFFYRTRYYLQRRAWRWFRRLGFQQPEKYVAAVGAALVHYEDEDFQKGENYLDSWGFMHACFGTHPAVEFSASRAGFRAGTGLADLTPAPAFPQLWFSAAGMREAITLATLAGARAVRTWAAKLLALPQMSAAATPGYDDFRRLLFAADADIQAAGLRLLENSPEAARWTVAQWLTLLESPAADAVAASMQQQVRPDRLDAAQCLSLACARPVSVARMGFAFLQDKSLTEAETRTLSRAAAAKCAAVTPSLTAWCLDKLAALAGDYDREPLCAFFDSLLEETRTAAWVWLTAHRDGAAWADAVLWSRLAETPFEDLRLRLVDELAIRSRTAAQHAADLSPVWTSVLLAVHRGSRSKPKAAQQVAAAIRADHAKADALLPVLAVAVRSLRAPEHRAGLAAVASLLNEEPLTAAVQRHLPEVQWA